MAIDVNVVNAIITERNYGSFYKTYTAGSTDSQAVTANVYELWNTGTFNSGTLNNFTRSTSRLTYTGMGSLPFSVSFCVVAPAGNTSGKYYASLYKNGAALTDSECRQDIPNIEAFTINNTFPVVLTTNDYLEIWVKSNLTTNFDVSGVTLVINAQY